MPLYFLYSCTEHTRHFFSYSSLNRLIPIYYKCKMKKIITFYPRDMNYDIPCSFKSIWNQFGVFVLNVKVFGLLFLWGLFFTVKDRYKISRDHPCMKINTMWYHHYLNLFICRTESPYFYTLIWGPLFQNCPSKESQNTVQTLSIQIAMQAICADFLVSYSPIPSSTYLQW